MLAIHNGPACGDGLGQLTNQTEMTSTSSSVVRQVAWRAPTSSSSTWGPTAASTMAESR
jgi:hypothetical protein